MMIIIIIIISNTARLHMPTEAVSQRL